MNKIVRLLAIGVVLAPSLGWHVAEPRDERRSTCAADDVTIKIKRFSIGSSIGGIAIGPDRNVWFTVFDRDRIGRLTRRGKVTYFSHGLTPPETEAPVVPAVGLRGITKGPDGNLWFTEFNAERIGRITPDGTITEFSAGITPPSEGYAANFGIAAPHSITAGADGNLWFTENGADRIGRITPDGAITEFTGITNSTLAQPGAITKGPDGNVWFAEVLGNRIGRVTPEGLIREFSIPADPQVQYLRPFGITRGPDGNVWFTVESGGAPLPGHPQGSGAGAIGRITPLGEITQYFEGFSQGPPETTPGLPRYPSTAGLRGITRGPDGDLWALETNGLLRITPSGKVTEFPIELNLTTLGDETLVAGPHRTLWFADNYARDLTRARIACTKT